VRSSDSSFEHEEYKLKRINGLPALDESCNRTLLAYVQKLQNANRWFGNKPWQDLTKGDVKRVYDGLEGGMIFSQRGKPVANRASYYSKIFEGKPLELAGKSGLARQVIEFRRPTERQVRFITEGSFRTLVSVISNPKHLLLFWLAWDIGENINSLLQLQSKDFTRQLNKDTGDVEYLVNLPREKLKRSRKARTEPTLHPETVRYADIVLEPMSENDRLFPFGHRQALKIMHSVAKKTGIRSMPSKTPATWKDLRSGMACHLLKSGWTRDEVNARLGHRPSSKTLDAYINYLALDRRRPKQELQTTRLEDLRQELEKRKRGESLLAERLRCQKDENQNLRLALDRIQDDMRNLKELIRPFCSRDIV